jgi:hypothetical protein
MAACWLPEGPGLVIVSYGGDAVGCSKSNAA